MRPFTTCVGLLALAGLSCAAVLGLPARAQSEAPRAGDDLDAWVESLDAPGPQHRMLDPLVGAWTGTVRAWASSTSEPEELTCRVNRTWVMDGRFIEERIEASLGSGPYEGFGLIGYNAADGRYQLTWIENQTTAMSFQTGRIDPDTKTFTTRGDYRDPASGFVISSHAVLDMSDPDRHTVVGYATAEDGRRFRTLEMELVRER